MAADGRRGARPLRSRKDRRGDPGGAGRLEAVRFARRHRPPGQRHDGARARPDRRGDAPDRHPPRPLPARVGDALRSLPQGGEGGRRRLGRQGQGQPTEPAGPEEPRRIRPPRAGGGGAPLARRRRGGRRRGGQLRQGGAGAGGAAPRARRLPAGAAQARSGRRLPQRRVRARRRSLPPRAVADATQGRSGAVGGGVARCRARGTAAWRRPRRRGTSGQGRGRLP